MTRKGAIKKMRRLFPAMAGREPYATRRPSGGMVEVGVDVKSGAAGHMKKPTPRERIPIGWGHSWAEAVEMAARRS